MRVSRGGLAELVLGPWCFVLDPSFGRPGTKDDVCAELNPATAQPIIRSSVHRKELRHEDVSLGGRSSRRAEHNGRGAVSARQSGHERAGTAVVGKATRW